ncbi:capsular biosynthesis protein [Burkholderia gladioli]|jgi:capsular polysaccharide export protein|uniref:capsular polysaccharide export protein, LipB/KpsS family n=1 Tax=Burkholderia gladioli TaxID=28095 RepID=UPI00163E62C8|nr:capsular biosynthesis protein [Burkholderia gladioli]
MAAPDTSTKDSAPLVPPRPPSLAPGARFGGWLRGGARFVWTDNPLGMFAARIASWLKLDAMPICAGPIMPRGSQGGPPLSWFQLRSTHGARHSLVTTIGEYLRTPSSALERRETASLMRRVVDCDALHVRRRIAQLPAAWHQPREKKRVVIVDERTTTHADVCTPRRHRRRHFSRLVDTAMNTGGELWLFRSADPGSGSWLSQGDARLSTLPVLDSTHSLTEVLKMTDELHLIGASEGMAALIAGVSVHVHGSPYYAGWGLTFDSPHVPRRGVAQDIDSLFRAVFVEAAVYVDPHSHEIGELDTLLDSIELQHDVARRFVDLQAIAAVAFQWWKRPYATPYITAGGGALRWVSQATAVQPGELAAIWGGRAAETLPSGVGHFRIEDGFLHSDGLGSDMSAPMSQVLDRLGIYFDASRPSDLTQILNHTDFSRHELDRAAALRSTIVERGLTKYNLGRHAPTWQRPSGKRILLVPGQVADDASIRLGTGEIGTSEALLAEVRRRHPAGFIVYKPHPDVLSGNRTGLIEAGGLADVIDTEADLISLIDIADEIHTLSSLSGFEALLRGKHVCTYGLPFYAGWGLTQDALEPRWRERALTLDQLTAGTLLRYAIYWDWELGLFTTPEAVVRRLADSAARPLNRIRRRRTRWLLKAYRWSRNAARHLAWRWVMRRSPIKQRIGTTNKT